MAAARFKRKLQDLEQLVIDVIYNRAEGPGAAVFAAFLRVLSLVFSGLVQMRFLLYRHRILHDQPLGCLVVVVGNLTVGGTGKTPVVEKFARSLAERGRKVAILSRGYKSKPEPLWRRWYRGFLLGAEPPPPKVVSDGNRVLLGPRAAGDEPYMLARNLPGVVVLVDKNRVKAGNYAIRKFGCDTLVLDDGMQYLPLKGRLNLLLVDSTNPVGNGSLLPRGILREPVKHLRRASYVFLTKSDGRNAPEVEALIRRHHPEVDIIECAHKPSHLQHITNGSRLELTNLPGRRIAAFSGIATPENFEGMLRRRGALIVTRRRFIDHHWFSEDDLDGVFDEAVAAGAEYVVTTEKDAVRISPERVFPLPLYYLRLEIGILRGAADFDEAVSRVCFAGEQRMSATAPPA